MTEVIADPIITPLTRVSPYADWAATDPKRNEWRRKVGLPVNIEGKCKR